ncbi:MAG TPA: hypothetical protein VMH80_14670 [Bryobacteraceae bacterium]|nr:hypothetical protein [Bryobacteraceae bacterium]
MTGNPSLRPSVPKNKSAQPNQISFTSTAEIIDRVQITCVAAALGVKVRSGRCVAVWRKDADGWNVALSDAKSVWFDHARGEGGGILSFVQRVRGCDRRTALQWLADYAGVPLNHQTEANRRDWARRMEAAKPEAELLVRWKLETLEDLRIQRNKLQRTYHNAVYFFLSHDAEECVCRGDLRYELALGIGETYWSRVEELDQQIDRLEAASYPELLLRFRGGAVA